MTLSQLKQWYGAHQKQILEDFFTFLKMPSISTDPAYAQKTAECAKWLCDYLKTLGLQAELWQTSGHPIVFASHLTSPNNPTVLIYHHYDVQPVDPVELWESDPFNPVVKNNAVYARGALDNKGQLFYSIHAVGAFLKLVKDAKINIKILIEGEEESGGKGTTELLPLKKKELQADHLLVVDFDLPRAHTPGITLGMRGIVTMDVTCKNSAIDLHSGSHGGIALNPNRALITLLSKLWDPSGKVAVPGFYDAVKPLSNEERELLDQKFDQEHYTKTFGVKAFAPEPGYSLVESNWIRPTLEINGISGGYTGVGFKTVIPSSAQAKISCRLVMTQDPKIIAEAIRSFLIQNKPDGIELTCTVHHGAKAFRSSLDAPISKIVIQAYEEVFKKSCLLKMCGASVPIITELAPLCGADVAMIGMGLEDDDIHAPNEHFGLDRFELGFLTIGRILGLLASGHAVGKSCKAC